MTTVEERPPPPESTHAGADVERATLGAMLLAPRVIDDVAETITGPAYVQPRHELIHDAILALHLSGDPVDPITVADELQRRGQLDRAGGHAYLHQLVTDVATPGSAPYYARLVDQAHMLRRVEQIGVRVTELGRTHTDNPIEHVNAARDELDSIVIDDRTDIPNEQAVYDAIDDLETSPGLATPWRDLTDTLAGWKPGALYIIGARPSIGKSVIGNGIVLDAARRHVTGMLFTLEMGRSEVYHRLFANVGDVDNKRIQHRTLTDHDYAKIADASAHLAALPLHIDDRSALTVAQIRAAIKAEQRKRDVGVVVIDYLQLLTPPPSAGKEDRRVQVDSISRNLKALAKDCHVPVVALTQLNRKSEDRHDKTPTMADLREAGGQEQDADVVMLLHRDLRDDPDRMQLIVAKNRHGALRRIMLRFRGMFSRAEDVLPGSDWSDVP